MKSFSSIRIFPFFFLLICSLSSAQTQYLLIDGGSDEQSNYWRYYNDIRNLHEELSAQGRVVNTLAKGGKWVLKRADAGDPLELSDLALTEEGKKAEKFSDLQKGGKAPSYPPIAGPATSADDIRKALQKMSMTLKSGDNLVIFVSDHGAPGKDPGSSEICLWGGGISYDEFGNLLKEVLPSNIRVQIASKACFSGGVHAISRSLPNVCGVSSTNHLTVSYSGKTGSDAFEGGFIGEIHNLSAKTFRDAATAGMYAQEKYNPAQPRLSSMDYVETILRTGAHDKFYYKAPIGTFNRFSNEWEAVGPIFSDWVSLTLKRKHNDSGLFLERLKGGSCHTRDVLEADCRKLEGLSDILKKLAEPYQNDSGSLDEKTAPEKVTLYKKALKDLEDHKGKYKGIIDKLKEKYGASRTAWAKELATLEAKKTTLQGEMESLKKKCYEHMRRYDPFPNEDPCRDLSIRYSMRHSMFLDFSEDFDFDTSTEAKVSSPDPECTKLEKQWKEKLEAREGLASEEGDLYRKYGREFYQISDQADEDLQTYYWDREIMDEMDLLTSFSRVATPQQIKKYFQLVECESAPL